MIEGMEIDTLKRNINVMKSILKAIDDNKLVLDDDNYDEEKFNIYKIRDSIISSLIKSTIIINNEKYYVTFFTGFQTSVKARCVFKGILYVSSRKVFLHKENMIKKISFLEKELINRDVIKWSLEESNKRKRI